MVMATYSNSSRTTWAESSKRLAETFRKWGVDFGEYTVDCDVPPARRNSHMWGAEGSVTLRYRLPGRDGVVVMTLATQDSPAKNLNSIMITVEAIRMQERRGLGGLVQAHYLALAAPLSERDPFEVLGLRPDAQPPLIEAAYRALAKDAHPDVGGSDEAMEELNVAKEAALKRVGV